MVVFANIARTTSVVPPPLSVTLFAPSTIRGPVGETVALRLMVPENPFRLVKFRKILFEEPCEIVSDDGVAEMLKSGGERLVTANEPTAVCVSDPLVAVTV